MTDDTIAELRGLLAKATPGPYRAHDHEGMRAVGSDPADWVGYAWVGRLTKDSTPDGRWDAGWADLNRRKDGCKEYRERASVDAHLIAAAVNALPALLDAAERVRVLEAALEDAQRDLWHSAEAVRLRHYNDARIIADQGCARARAALGTSSPDGVGEGS